MMQHHINAAVYLSAQGLAFRGHGESRLSSNRGNFLELMELLGDFNHDLKTFLDKEHITYTSHEPQNELIKSVCDEVRNEIQKRITNSTFISVMMDDTSDKSNVEQSAVSVRLVYQGEIEEHLLALVDSSEDQSADGLTTVMLETLQDFDVKPESCSQKLIGQSYDGASTMSGELNGVQTQMREHFPAAYYTHCVAHRMALCAKTSANKIARVTEFFKSTDKIITFFRSSPKRTRNLGQNLPKPGDTRWLSRDSAISVIDSSYEAIGNALFVVATNREENSKIREKARKLVSRIQGIEFIFLLKLYRRIFEHCSPIMKVMQRPSLDVVQLKSMLNDFLRTLERFDLNQIWSESMENDPVFPIIVVREGWRAGMEEEGDGSKESWQASLFEIATDVIKEFSDQVSWRFQNLERFQWIELIHPAKFEER